MNCPFCPHEGTRPELHAHLTDEHADRVETWEDGFERRYYRLACPACGDEYRKQVKPRLRDPMFLEEYAREIRVVAFDRFLYHLSDHEEEAQGA